MLKPPSLTNVLHYPVTTSVAVAAAVVTGYSWAGHSIDGITMDVHVWSDWELWRALTSTLPHGGMLHLAFNLYWLWVFGTLVESVYGHFKCAAIFVLFAFGSMLAEFVLFNGGIGLSGVGYGLWGMIWVLEQRDVRFHGAVDAQTSKTFVIWFFLCIGLTVTNLMPVANVAHGVGALLGLLLGLTITCKGAQKWKSLSGLVALITLVLLGATVFWPWVNLSKYAEPQVEWIGWDALEHDNPMRAAKFLAVAVQMPHTTAQAWYNLGIAYQRSGHLEAAIAAFEHAVQMPDADAEMQRTAQGIKAIYQSTSTNAAVK